MADFDWRTEDEHDWPVEPGLTTNPKQRPSWQFPLLILIILALTAGGLYSLFTRRAEEAEQRIKDDVRRTHELVMGAADAGDDELFITFMSGASSQWLDLQRQAVRQGEFNQTPWLNLLLAERPYRIDNITLTPTLDEATVLYTRWYDGGAGEFALQHTAVYRRGEDRWLLAPPTADFWGDEAVIEEEQFVLRYLERDEEPASRLAEDLKALMPEICQIRLGGSCPDNWQVKVTLSANLEHKLNPNRIIGAVDNLSLRFPTPTLLGMPVDGDGYEALLEGYRVRLEREVVAALPRFFADRPELLPPILEIGSFNELPVADITFACVNGVVGRAEWNVFRYSLRTGDWRIIFQQEYTGEDSGFIVPLPETEGYVIQEYLRDDLLNARLLMWQGGETVLVGEQKVNFDSALAAPYFFNKSDPTGRYLLIASTVDADNSWYVLDRQNCDSSDGCKVHRVMNFSTWSPDGSQMLMEEPPNRAERPASIERPILRAGALGENPVQVGRGFGPFWLSETLYGYGRLNDDGLSELVVAGTADDEPEVWVEAAALAVHAPFGRDEQELIIWRTWPNPADPSMVMVATTPSGFQNTGPYDFFLISGGLDGGEPQLEYLYTAEFFIPNNVEAFSPDGRYLLFSQRGSVLFFRDLQGGESIRIDLSAGFFVGWTPDSAYYIQRFDDALTLTNPESGSEIRLLYDFSTCSGIQWLPPD